jgi:hypothetical protein
LGHRRALHFGWRPGRDQSFENIRRCCSATRVGEGCGDPLGAIPTVDCAVHGFPEATGRQLPYWKANAGASDLDATGDFRLVAPERHRHDGDAVRERLLGDPHPRMADDARAPLEHRRVRQEALDTEVGTHV